MDAILKNGNQFWLNLVLTSILALPTWWVIKNLKIWDGEQQKSWNQKIVISQKPFAQF